MTYFGDPSNASRSNSNCTNQSPTQGTLSGGIDASVTTMTVQSGEGLNFIPGQIIKIGSSAEIIVISSISGDTFTIARGQYGSTATTHTNGDAVSGAGIGGNTTLDANITTTGTETITVGSTSAMVAGNMIKINNEYMVIGVVASGTTLTIHSSGRGYSNSTAATHTSGATVTGVFIGTRDQNSQPWVQTSVTSNVSGTEFYQFSNDGTNWSQYPVTGFSVSVTSEDTGIHTFHQAIKGKRYFRIIFENGGATASTSFNAYSYFGVFNNGMLPLSQSINNDQDAMVVRSVGVGEDPVGTFINIKADGDAFLFTDNLAGTTLVTPLNSDTVGDIEVADVTGFVSQGTSQIMIGTEFISYTGISTGSNTFTIPSGGRGLYNSGASAHAFGTTVGGVYDSGILDLSGYTQIATKLKAGGAVQPRFVWYSDSGGTSIVRILAPSYPSSTQSVGDYSYLSAPIFSNDTRYLLGNKEETETGDIFYTADFTTKAISSQILTVADELLPQMTAGVTKSITVGRQPDGDYVSTPADGEEFNTTTALGYTTLGTSMTTSTTGNITVGSTSTLASSGYLNISGNNTVVEIVSYTKVNSTTINIPSTGRAQFGTTATSHSSGDNMMGVYSSEISTGNWSDTDGYGIIEIIAVTDVISAVGGVIIKYTDDAQAVNPITRFERVYTYTALNSTDGVFRIRTPVILDGYSLLYVNGTTAQTSFFLSSTHRVKGNANIYTNSGVLLTGDYSTEVSLGNIINRQNINKFGRNSDIDINSTPEDIWGGGGVYTGQPVSPTLETVTITSGSASDTSAGTGARTIRIEGLRTSTSSQYTTEDITMNGTTGVVSTKTWYRVNRGYVLTTGSAGYNVGDIICKHTTTTPNVFFSMPAQFNQTTACAYTIPYGLTGIIKKIFLSITRASGAAGSALILLQVRDTLGGWCV